ncbi:sulfite exporter TauE/SafE family protein [Actinomadura sp. J1-007]|uniref:sulfite exporter TauE/SafE family protein n=1 Tax=Actinomadura sp. J1-007 TaxID=2661913 RepID=UPI002814A9BC|nr:sulfite exporter TauE/SafE family protein [Actinomadura sp. J1-007]
MATHVATGALGTAAYTRSGQLREPETRRTAVILAVAALVGTPLGVQFNTAVTGRAFGILLASAVAVTGVLVWARERRVAAAEKAARADGGAETEAGAGAARLPGWAAALVGLGVAAAAGLFGLGGPMLSVPVLVVLRVPVLRALAAAQAQSVVIASVGTAGYALHGAIDWRLAALVGVPELAGVIAGWRIAHAVPARRLTFALAATLLLLAPYLALHA